MAENKLTNPPMTSLRHWLLPLCLVSLSALASTVDDVKHLVEQGRYDAAYALASGHPELFGEPGFDYYFGIAATDAGHAGEGVLALERCVLQQPDNLPAHAELARAYFMLGEDQRAREEFNTVLKQHPSDAVRRTIDRYLDALDAREARYRPTAALYVETGVGYDSNINGGVSDANINLPVFGDVVVTPSGVRKSDTFSALAAGAFLTRPLAPGWTLFGSLGADGKFNRRHHDTDITSTALSGGIDRQEGDTGYRLAAGQYVVTVGSDRYRTTDALTGQWRRRFGNLKAIEASVQWARYYYPGANRVRNATFSGLGIGYRQGFARRWQPVLGLAVSYGQEHNDRSRPDLGRELTGLHAAIGVAPTMRWNVSLGVDYQDSRYGAEDSLLATRRHDAYSAASFGAKYAITRQLSLRGELLFSDNRSNLALYQYRRDVAAIKLRYDIK